MDKLTQYRNKVQQLLKQYANDHQVYGDIENETIFDTKQDHYQLVHVGWDDEQRIHPYTLTSKIAKYGFNIMAPKTILHKNWLP